MTIEEIKNNALENITEFVTDTAKDAFTKWLKEKALPTVKDVSEAFITELKNSASNENGWNKFRDAIFLPVIITGSLWLAEKILDKLISNEITTE